MGEKVSVAKAREIVNNKDITKVVDLEKSKSGLYVCPFCGSGKGEHKSGALLINNLNKPPQRLWCFSCQCGTGKSEDVLGSLRRIWKCNEAEVFERFKLDVEYPANYFESKASGKTGKEVNKVQQVPGRGSEETKVVNTEQVDYTQYYIEAHSHIKETDYATKTRGIDPEVLERLKIGYDPKWVNPKNGKYPSPRIIFPGENGYGTRDIRPDKELNEIEKGFCKAKVGHPGLFNIECLDDVTQPVYVVEGQFDCLSIETVGGAAIALCGIASASEFVKRIKQRIDEGKFVPTIIISLDNEPEKESVQKANKVLHDGLLELQVKFFEYNVSGKYKDPNEALLADRAAFEARVREGERLSKAEALKEYNSNYSASSFLQDFVNGISKSASSQEIPTGFRKLDNVLDGGLYEGLYCVGAISSLGKTTYCLQIADQIAQQGQDVIIIALEMGKTELIAKSISRETFIETKSSEENKILARTYRQISNGKRYKNYSEEQLLVISKSVENYNEFADHIYIQEGLADISVDDVRQTVENHIFLTGNKPVVLIDYLQILKPHNERATDKQNTDYAIVSLKRLSRDYKIPVIVISSFNRENYKEAVSPASFKESGAVEYSCDVLMGLQLMGTGKKNSESDVTAKLSDLVRQVELVILKNRAGAIPKTPIRYNYHAAYNYFEEV